jgi:hypothetical protein
LNEAPNTWSQTYGGADRDRAWTLIATADGGYAIAGDTASSGAGNHDFWLVKTDAYGNMEWNQTYGGPEYEEALALVQTSDGGYALAGATNSFVPTDVEPGSHSAAEGTYCWLVKTDAYGNMEWSKTYGDGRNRARSLVVNHDGGYTLGCGNLLIKTDADGNVEWQQTYTEYIYCLTTTDDGGYAVAGFQHIQGSSDDVWVAKTDSNGYVEWNQTFGGADWGRAYSLAKTVDGGYAVAGYIDIANYSGGDAFWLIKIDADGTMAWEQRYIAQGRGPAVARGLVATSDGGYALAGTKLWVLTDYDFWLIKTDADGNVEWDQTFAGGADDNAYALVATSDGGYVIAGETYSTGAGLSDIWLIKTY